MPVFNAAVERADLSTVLNRPDYIETFFDAAVEESAFMRMAQRLPNMGAQVAYMSVMSALPIAYFVNGDTGLRQTTEVKWKDKNLNAEELAVIVPIPINVIRDAKTDLQARVKKPIGTAIGKAVDAAVLFGTNAPSAWPDDILTSATTASHVVSLATKTDVYEALLDEDGVLAKVEADGFMSSGAVAHTSMKGKLRGNRSSQGMPIFARTLDGNYAFDGDPIFFPRNGGFDVSKALLVAGDWNEVVYALRQDMEFNVFTEGVIQDNAGNIVWNLAQQRMVAIMVTVRLAWQIANPINWMNETEATRFPFAVLTA